MTLLRPEAYSSLIKGKAAILHAACPAVVRGGYKTYAGFAYGSFKVDGRLQTPFVNMKMHLRCLGSKHQ